MAAAAPPIVIPTRKPQPLPFRYQFVAGAVAGVSEQGAGTGQQAYKGMFDCFYKIIKNEGFPRLYRGIAAPIMMEAPKRAVKFAANDSWGAFYRGLLGVEKQTQSLSILTGCTAGASEALIIVPFELVKIRLQDRSSAGKYRGTMDAVIKIIRQEGLLALYNGMESTLWRNVVWNGGYFGCIFQVRAQLPKPNPDNKSGQVRNDFIAGGVVPKIDGKFPKYNWALPAVGTVYRGEGFKALYKGFVPKVLRLGPGGGILLIVFTGVVDFFRLPNTTDGREWARISAGTKYNYQASKQRQPENKRNMYRPVATKITIEPNPPPVVYKKAFKQLDVKLLATIVREQLLVIQGFSSPAEIDFAVARIINALNKGIEEAVLKAKITWFSRLGFISEMKDAIKSLKNANRRKQRYPTEENLKVFQEVRAKRDKAISKCNRQLYRDRVSNVRDEIGLWRLAKWAKNQEIPRVVYTPDIRRKDKTIAEDLQGKCNAFREVHFSKLPEANLKDIEGFRYP
ncbi:hypothetical protein B7463_g9235, partial [Scytalidium lignicola]